MVGITVASQHYRQSQKKMKILIIHNIISPARIALFNELNDYYKKRGDEFKVLFLSESDKNRNWKNEFEIKFNYQILKNHAIRIGQKDLFTFFINLNIKKILNQNIPDKIICFGWDHLSAYISNVWARKNKKQFTLWCGSTKYEKSWRRTLFKPLVKYLLKRTNDFIVYGTRAKNYLMTFGVDKSKINIFFNSIDVDYFQNKIIKFTDIDRRNLKKIIGIKTKKIILFNGQLIERKGIFNLLNAFKTYQEKDNDISLLIIGTGKEEEKIKRIIQRENVKNIFFTGFIPYKELYKYYAISDVLILPSKEEVWGLVVNEAMACGLPVITTRQTGSSVDLVEENRNGIIINTGTPKNIKEAIEKIFELKLNKKNNSLEIIKKIKFEFSLNKIKI